MKNIKKVIKKKYKNQQGSTLIELVIVVILLSIAVPSTFSIIGQISLQNYKNLSMYQQINAANSKMEEIIAFKRLNDDWSNTIANFSGSETLPNNYTRSVTVTQVSNWISEGSVNKNAFKITIGVNSIQGTTYNLTTYLVEK